MTWSRRFLLEERLRSSLWFVPLLGALLGIVLGTVISVLDERVGLPAISTFSPNTATTVLAAVIGAAAALIGFVITVTVLAVQMAASTFSPRYMRLWYRDGMLKASLAALLGTLTLAYSLLRRVENDFVPNLGVSLTGTALAVSLILFLLFFHRFLHRLRPVAVTALVAQAGRTAFRDSLRIADRDDVRWSSEPPVEEPTLVVRSTGHGAIQAIHPDGLATWAHEHDAEVVLAHSVGDFVHTGQALMRVYGGRGVGEDAASELEAMVALSIERTIQQDPAFAIRIMVDIAIRALSPAVNDPTTGVQVLDHLGETLRVIGSTDLEKRRQRGTARTSGLVMPVRRWEDFLQLAVTEIREFGATSVQITRRLRAMLEELNESVLPEHRRAVEIELARLRATVDESWGSSHDLDIAGGVDGQALGGPPVGS